MSTLSSLDNVLVLLGAILTITLVHVMGPAPPTLGFSTAVGGGFLLTSDLLLPSQANPAPVVVNTDTLDTPPYVSFSFLMFPPFVASGFQML